MRLRILVVFTAVAVLVFLMAGGASAAPRLFGTTGSGGTLSTLVELDPATGALLSTIGPVGYTVNGLTYDASTGKLWGSTSAAFGGFVGLLEIDMTTGAGTPVGTGWGLPAGDPVVSLTTNASGAMYGWWEPAMDSLVSIDKALGTATLVSWSGLVTGNLGLSFSNDGTLYLYNYGGDYYTVDTTTGVASYVGDLGVAAHHGDFHPVSNIYYGIDRTGSGPKNILMLDLVNGSYVGSMPTVDGLHTLTFGPDPVPEAGTLAALSGFLTSGGLLLWRRRRTG